MAVSMQSTESGGVVNFSVGDTLTVNGKIVAQGLVTPNAGVRYADIGSKQTFERRGSSYTYTVPADGILTYGVSVQAADDYEPALTVTVNGVQVYHANGAYNANNGFGFDSLPVKANDTITSVMDASYSGASMYVYGTFYSYR